MQDMSLQKTQQLFNIPDFLCSEQNVVLSKKISNQLIGVSIQMKIYPLEHVYFSKSKQILSLKDDLNNFELGIWSMNDGSINFDSNCPHNSISINLNCKQKSSKSFLMQKNPNVVGYKLSLIIRMNFYAKKTLFLSICHPDKLKCRIKDLNFQGIIKYTNNNNKQPNIIEQRFQKVESIEGKLQNIHCSLQAPNNLLKFQFSTSLANLPISHPYDYIRFNFQIPDVNLLPNYSSHVIDQQQERQIYVCHDYKGGYGQDINDYEQKHCLSYRMIYMSQCSIFNYFSHHVFTIPPKHWRILCKKYKVKCLGTYIIEQNHKISEDEFLSDQYRKLLVYLARQQQFDGYLINIQVPVTNVNRLLKWLQTLTKQLHTAIPHSCVVWYDSVSALDGSVKYQNQLNYHNLPFLKLVDYFFTNYWWNSQKLINTANLALNQTLTNKIFMGNDVFGRNTFMGGKENIYQAANAILKLKNNPLNIGLFAPAYFYERFPENRTLWLRKQQELYQGLISKKVNVTWNQIVNGGNGWSQEGPWWVTSFEWCQRIFYYSLSDYCGLSKGNLKLFFSVVVQGTPPNTKDPYKILVQFYDKQYDFVLHQNQWKAHKYARSEQEIVEIKLNLSFDLITTNLYIRIIQIGKDAEHWAGNYGVRFKDQVMWISSYHQEKNWLSRLPICNVSPPFHSFFNVGNGDYFFRGGAKTQANLKTNKMPYDCLSDMDLTHTMSLNPQSVSLNFSDAFYGGSCLQCSDSRCLLLKICCLSKQKNMKILLKGCKTQINIFEINSQGIMTPQQLNALSPTFQRLVKGTSKENDWIQFQSIIEHSQYSKVIGIQCKGSSNFLVGAIFFYDPYQIREYSLKSNILVVLSPEYHQCFPIHIDLIIKITKSKLSTFLVTVADFTRFFHYNDSDDDSVLKNIIILTNQPIPITIEYIREDGQLMLVSNHEISLSELLQNSFLSLQ